MDGWVAQYSYSQEVLLSLNYHFLSLTTDLHNPFDTDSCLTSMAQKTEKEETELKAVPENITLCVKCVAANSAMNNLCQNCFNASAEASTFLSAAATGGAKPKLHVFGEKPFRSASSRRSSPERSLNLPETSADLKKEPMEVEAAPPANREVNRCSGCRMKVGLTGFICRCGELFCANHRYSDRHDCSYDYKSAGREAIARENPVVKAAKIVKI